MNATEYRAEAERLADWAARKQAEAERRQRQEAVSERVAQLTLDGALAHARQELARQRDRAHEGGAHV
ncbi:MAG: hypothetical protein KatS3mg010_1532 [Acidimicrobiia bacterium]|nr:MAG: hypothetical protein KatS3mg010_1532 [Acidimicrobiia bacterium]